MSQQADLFKAETTWFHVFKDMIDSGDLARLDGSAIKSYLVVKSYTNFVTGRAFPPIELIAEKTGLSSRQVMRSLQELETLGYLTKEKVGRHNVYTLREKVTLKDGDGVDQAVATWDYVPNGVREAMADLKHVMMSGDFAGAKVVRIENMTVNINIQTGSHATQINITQSEFKKLPKDKQEALLAVHGGKAPDCDNEF